MTTFKLLRILFLLLLLAVTAFYTKTQRLDSTAWVKPLEVVIFPINADRSPVVERYIQNLKQADFSGIDRFTAHESQYYPVGIQQPTHTDLGSTVEAIPPAPPDQEQASKFSIALWSLQLRYWAYRNTPDQRSNKTRVRVFVLYHEATEGRRLQHSLGLYKGLLGIVHAFAAPEQNAQNTIVIAHELLHTLGASDKYADNGAPVFPDGFGEPDLEPRYPQRYAEIMAGRVALSADAFEMASDLWHCVIGAKTAREIRWLKGE